MHSQITRIWRQMVACRVVFEKSSSSLDNFCAYMFGRDGVVALTNLNEAQARALLAEFRRRCADEGIFADSYPANWGKRRTEAASRLRSMFIL